MRLAQHMAIASERVTATAIEATEFPDMAQAYRVSGVPKIVINDRVEFEGALPESQFLEAVLRAEPAEAVIRLLAAVGLLAVTMGAAAAASQTPLAVGVMAPDTKLVDQNGQSVRLADLTRQRDFVVVAFYVKAFTGG